VQSLSQGIGNNPLTVSSQHQRLVHFAVAAAQAEVQSGGAGALASNGGEATLADLDQHVLPGMPLDSCINSDALTLPRKLGSEAVEAGRSGAFQRLPMVSPSKELLESALRRAARVPANKKLKNEAQKAKNRC
jgi:hypothetical protein